MISKGFVYRKIYLRNFATDNMIEYHS